MYVWEYHLIKLMTGATVSFVLSMMGVPLLIACAIGMIGTVVIPHLIYLVTGKYALNVKDTVFDCVTSSLAFPAVLFHIYGWIIGVTWFAIWIGMYLFLLHQKWNSP